MLKGQAKFMAKDYVEEPKISPRSTLSENTISSDPKQCGAMPSLCPSDYGSGSKRRANKSARLWRRVAAPFALLTNSPHL
jgi:hypothetical protein